MKKIIILVLTASILFSLLTACGTAGGKGDSGNAVGGDKAASTTAPAQVQAIFITPGMELTDYQNNFVNLKKPYDDALEPLSQSGGMDALEALLARALPYLSIAFLCQYDALATGDEANKTGKLMLSGYDAVREKDGNRIKFSGGFTHEKDSGTNQKGDKVTQRGYLDTSTKELSFESKTERGGQVIDRTVLEAVILPDGTHIMQYLDVTHGPKKGVNATATAMFERFNSNGYEAITALLDGGVNFTVDSIIDKGDLQPATMARNYKVTGKFTVAGGKAKFDK